MKLSTLSLPLVTAFVAACASSSGDGGGGIYYPPADASGDTSTASPTCGDGKCEGSEAQACPADCAASPFCGDGVCNAPQETSFSCKLDCPKAGGSCAGSCGHASGSGCKCDDACEGRGDCCTDKIAVCGACPKQCSGKQCGDNGCGGVCGTCKPGSTCDEYDLCTETCTTSPACTDGTKVCFKNVCTYPDDLYYAFTFTSVDVPQFDGESAWDSVGGAKPELYVTLEVNGTLVCQTQVVANATHAGWGECLTGAQMNYPSTIVIGVYDEDAGPDDLIAEGEASDGDLANLLHAGAFNDSIGAEGTTKISFKIRPFLP